VAIAECCIAGGVGASVRLPVGVDPFAEAPGRAFVVSGAESALAGVSGAVVIGRVGGDRLELEGVLNAPVSELREAREHGLMEFL
jgi:hypothetical protein